LGKNDVFSQRISHGEHKKKKNEERKEKKGRPNERRMKREKIKSKTCRLRAVV